MAIACPVSKPLPSAHANYTSCLNIGSHSPPHLLKVRDSSSTSTRSMDKEPHKYFDHVVITVRSGDGGHGALLRMPKPKMRDQPPGKRNRVKEKRSYKRDADGSVILPMGGHGGDVILHADEKTDSLLDFHKTQRFNAKRGGNVDAFGYLTPTKHDGISAPALRIPVPVGTVVKRKRGGKLLADLAHAGDEILVARGGRGGISLVESPQRNRNLLKALNTNVMKSGSDKELVLGQPGEEVKLELILRIVADVGLVGLPNAGKSSLLAAITLAKPEIAPYPFTTLIPNLGHLDGDPNLGVWGYSSQATLADLPGLIRGAHVGKGLGRNFLRHLRRTRLLVHVVDASTEDPINDYFTLREELGMYNPEYNKRPHIIVLNKLDLPEAREKFDVIIQGIMGNSSPKDPDNIHRMEENYCSENEGVNQNFESVKRINPLVAGMKTDVSCPLAIIGISALKGAGIREMIKQIRFILKNFETEDKEASLTNGSSAPIVYKPLEYWI
eukprot:TRINITY_DN13490_c0_g1_i1.p1 TRINITY_DN13490_c0_g1~~TRINITY_DN13490_c0_g1_i1.p1  ORF type:complete len:499 (-),score=113.88 TRINITY_DN13490_c0_g1_i1:145-1641(-)